jgi:hypothetical protein
VAQHREDRPPAEALNECEKKVERLKEENDVLRYSSQTFGDLAERLNMKHKAVAEKRRRPRKQRRIAGKAGKR